MLVLLRQHLWFHCFGSEIRGRRLHVTRRVVAGDDVVSTASVRCDSHADLGGGGPDNLSCEGVSMSHSRMRSRVSEKHTVVAVLLEVAGAGDGLAVVEVLLANPGVGSVGVGRVGVALPVQVLTIAGGRGVGQGAGGASGGGEVLGPLEGVAGEAGIPGQGGGTDVGTGAVLAVQGGLLVGGEAGGGRGGGRRGRGRRGRGRAGLDDHRG